MVKRCGPVTSNPPRTRAAPIWPWYLQDEGIEVEAIEVARKIIKSVQVVSKLLHLRISCTSCQRRQYAKYPNARSEPTHWNSFCFNIVIAVTTLGSLPVFN
jgi:hypothetical protein